MGGSLTRDEAAAVFGAVRRLQRNSRDLPTTFEGSASGWLVAQPDEPADDQSGRRPLGALRRELADLVNHPDSGLSAQHKTVLGAYFGLNLYPSDLDGPIDPVTARVVRRRGGTHLPFTTEQVLTLRKEALHQIAARMPSRATGHTVNVGPVGDPFAATWMTTHLSGRSPADWLGTAAGHIAVDHARDLLSIGDAEPSRQNDRPPPRTAAGREQLLEELDLLLHTYAATSRTRPTSAAFGRARAALSIAIWETITNPHRPRPGTPPRFGSTAHDPAVGRTLTRLQLAPDIAGHVAQGDADDAAVDALLATVPLSGDVTDQWHLLQLALSTIRPPRTITGPTVIRVLAAAIRNAQEREDRSVVGLTRLLFDEYPRPTPPAAAAAQLYALSTCSIVLTARLEWRLAAAAIDTADHVLDQAQWPTGRDPRVERAEWRYQLVLLRTALERRRAEHELTVRDPAAAMHAVDRATDLLKQAERMLSTMPAFRTTSLTSDAGDANPHYLTRLRYRTAEVESLRAHAGRLVPLSDAALLNATRAAHEASTDAIGIARADTGNTTPTIPLIKARLSWALAVGNEDVTTDLTRRLLDAGWPAYRSLIPIVLAMTGRVDVLPSEMRHAAERAAAVAARTAPQHPLVPDEVRRRQAQRHRR